MLAVLHELVKTAVARLDLSRRRRESACLMREFPPRCGASPFWPAIALAGLGVAIYVGRAEHRRAHLRQRVSQNVLSEPLAPAPKSGASCWK